MSGATFFWLAPLFPLAAFALLACGFSRNARLATGIALAALGGSLLVSLAALLAATQGARASVGFPWLSVGGRTLTLALWLDPLGALLAALVSLIGFVVFLYAASYMAQDLRCGRFFAEFSLFVGAMLVLVLASDLITLFIAWELVGLCSYLLIGFWFERPGAPAAATKAFFTTRLADLALLAGVLLLIGTVGQGRIENVLAAVSSGKIAPGLLLVIALLLFTGAAGKSAQVPFQGWLPDAMLGPTPVSALLHSATMVAAGVFLVARLYPLFLVATPALAVVAWIGVITALLGGAAALVETDLKRTLAYSTMSQIGLMFVGLGSGSLLAGVLLLVAQAFYKATLFLASGAVDHVVKGTAFERMGGLLRRMPWTAVAFALGTAALAGLPVTLALPPKDPVLSAAWQANSMLFVATLLASLLTALYSARIFGLVFLGAPSPSAKQAHEAKPGLLMPLLIMAGMIPLALLADATLLQSPLATFLGARRPDVPIATWLALGIAVIGGTVGLWARFVWPRAVILPLFTRLRPVFAGEFGLQVLYRGVAAFGRWSTSALGLFDRGAFGATTDGLVAAFLSAVRGLGALDRSIFDAFAAAIASGTLKMVRISGRFDLRVIDASIVAWGKDLLAGSQRLRRLQTGRIENYLLVVFFWCLGVIALAVFLTMVH